ncbi:hypothetical protein NC652_015516 [Populus alba x Populus x berolinensis]|nr:hypothetical protein NC652_015516 [Populus alba x Populus x berolinensis]
MVPGGCIHYHVCKCNSRCSSARIRASCRCCFFVGRVPYMSCGKVCCSSPAGENCCIAT